MADRSLFTRSMTFKRKLFLYSLLVSIIPVLLLGFFASYLAAGSVQEEVNRNHRIILKQVERQVDGLLQGLIMQSLQIAGDTAVSASLLQGISMQNLDPTIAMMDKLSQYRSASNIGFNVSLIYRSFDYVYSNYDALTPLSSYRYADVLKLVDARQDNLSFIAPGTYPGQSELLLAGKIYTTVQSLSNVLLLHIDMKRFNEAVQSADLGTNRKLFVLDGEGRVVTTGAGTGSGEVGQFPLSVVRQLHNEEMIDYEGVSYQLSTTRSVITDWTYAAMTPIKELTAKSDAIKQATWVLASALIVVWTLIALYGSNRLSGPIRHLARRISGQSGAVSNELQTIDRYMSQIEASNLDLQNRLSEHLPHVMQRLVLQMLHGEMEEDLWREQMKVHGQTLQGRYFFVCVAVVDNYEQFALDYGEHDRALLLYAMSKMASEVCERTFSSLTVSPQPGQVAIIIGAEDGGEVAQQSVSSLLGHFHASVRQYFQFSVTLSVSGAHLGYKGINKAYLEALSLMEYRFLVGKNKMITKTGMADSGLIRHSGLLFVKRHKTILSSITAERFDEASKQIRELVGLLTQTTANVDQAKGFFVMLLGGIDQFLQEIGYELGDCFPEDVYETLQAFDTVQEIGVWMSGVALPAIEAHLSASSSLNRKRIVSQMVSYIHENAEADASLQQIADKLNVSAPLLSRIFKEENGVNFVTFLIEHRMQKAKQWLTETDMSVKDISSRLRYTTPQNFSRVFKQVVGLTPGAYRDQCTVERESQAEP